MTMATERLASLEQVRAFVEGSEGLDFAVADRSSRNDFVRRILVKFDYAALGKADKGLMKRFLGKATGLSRAQLTRLIGQRAKTGRIVDRRGGAPAKPFARRYSLKDKDYADLKDFALANQTDQQGKLHQLRICFSEAPRSERPEVDWKRHRIDRSMRHYEAVMAWVGLLLFNYGLATFSGKHVNRALLFPMEEVFEDYVVDGFRRYQRDYREGPQKAFTHRRPGNRAMSASVEWTSA